MPLHAVTAMYGEQGLRARFAAEIARFPDPACREQAARALQLAGELHAGDRRQREPYVNHLLRVALRIMSHYGVDDTEVICAALLHDAVEDHADGLAAGGRAGAVAALAAGFGPRVAGLVDAVTNPERVPGIDRHEQYRAHVAASLAASPWARVIKASDFTDNGVGLIHTSGPKTAGSPASTRRWSRCWLISSPARTRPWRPRSRPGSSASSSPPRNDSPSSPPQRPAAQATPPPRKAGIQGWRQRAGPAFGHIQALTACPPCLRPGLESARATAWLAGRPGNSAARGQRVRDRAPRPERPRQPVPRRR